MSKQGTNNETGLIPREREIDREKQGGCLACEGEKNEDSEHEAAKNQERDGAEGNSRRTLGGRSKK